MADTLVLLSENDLGDDGATAVSASLARLQKLRDLDLSKNAIGNEGGMAVAREATKLPVLRALILRWKESTNPISPTIQAAICQMLPRISAGNLLL